MLVSRTQPVQPRPRPPFQLDSESWESHRSVVRFLVQSASIRDGVLRFGGNRDIYLWDLTKFCRVHGCTSDQDRFAHRLMQHGFIDPFIPDLAVTIVRIPWTFVKSEHRVGYESLPLRRLSSAVMELFHVFETEVNRPWWLCEILDSIVNTDSFSHELGLAVDGSTITVPGRAEHLDLQWFLDLIFCTDSVVYVPKTVFTDDPSDLAHILATYWIPEPMTDYIKEVASSADACRVLRHHLSPGCMRLNPAVFLEWELQCLSYELAQPGVQLVRGEFRQELLTLQTLSGELPTRQLMDLPTPVLQFPECLRSELYSADEFRFVADLFLFLELDTTFEEVHLFWRCLGLPWSVAILETGFTHEGIFRPVLKNLRLECDGPVTIGTCLVSGRPE